MVREAIFIYIDLHYLVYILNTLMCSVHCEISIIDSFLCLLAN